MFHEAVEDVFQETVEEFFIEVVGEDIFQEVVMFQEAVEDSAPDRQKKGDDPSSNVAKANDTKKKDKIASHPIKIARPAEARIRTSLAQMFQPAPTTPQAGSTRRAATGPEP